MDVGDILLSENVDGFAMREYECDRDLCPWHVSRVLVRRTNIAQPHPLRNFTRMW